MDFSFSDQEIDFREAVREFARANWPADRRFLLGRSERQDDYELEVRFRRAMGELGWFVLDWPPELGGQARSPVYRYLLSWELFWWGAPYHVTALTLVAPLLIKYGNSWQREHLLSRIATGEIDFSLGYTESEAGSDLASLVTRARRTSDGYAIAGQKLYTSYARQTDYIWLAARTDPTAPKHKGISIFIVDKRLPGVSIAPLSTIDGGETYITYYDDVVVPPECLVGEENQGWRYIVEALDQERITLFPVAQADRIFRWLAEFARTDGADNASQRRRLAELSPRVEGATLLSHRCAWQASRGEVASADAAKLKVIVTELLQELGRLAVELHAPEAARLYLGCIMQTFGGGATEVLKDVIGYAGLGLPRG
jgi:alkylation response protein AidB-like acyl-CoA dehydrogenase